MLSIYGIMYLQVDGKPLQRRLYVMENKQNIIDEDVQARLDLLDAIIESK